jgi:XRE family transcriptional regulator, aerobic/anaerobic benzoate catabolism transcriptional regulator
MARSRNPVLGETVRRLREERGLSREVLAVNAGLSTGALSRLELGRSDPAWSTICAAADALGLTIVELAAAVLEAQDSTAP